MKDHSAKGGVIGVWKCVYEGMHRVSSHGVVINSRSIDILAVEVASKDWIWQFAEELFQKSCDTIDVVLERFGIPKVDLGGVYAG